MMEEPLIDFTFLHDISENDPVYICEVLEIFLSTTPHGLEKLEKMINGGEPWDDISKHAHSLKSSVSVIKIRGLYDQLAEIEQLTRKKEGADALPPAEKEKVVMLMNDIMKTFREAHPLLIAEMEKNKHS